MDRDVEMARSLDKQLRFVNALYEDLNANTRLFITNGARSFRTANYMDKNHGKCALQRKITMLRQELLNLERVLEDA